MPTLDMDNNAKKEIDVDTYEDEAWESLGSSIE